MPSVTMNPLPTHFTHAIPPLANLHYLDYDDFGDRIHMRGWKSSEPMLITFSPYFGEAIETRVAKTSQRSYVVLTLDDVMYE